MTIWLRVCLCLQYCLIISLITLMNPYRNNLFQLKLFHKVNISRLTRRLFLLICGSLSGDLYNSTLRDLLDEHAPLKSSVSGTACVFIIKCSKSVKVKTRIPVLLSNENIRIERSKHVREIKGLFSVLWINYYMKVRLSFQILSTQIKIWPIVLTTSSVNKY